MLAVPLLVANHPLDQVDHRIRKFESVQCSASSQPIPTVLSGPDYSQGEVSLGGANEIFLGRNLENSKRARFTNWHHVIGIRYLKLPGIRVYVLLHKQMSTPPQERNVVLE